MMNKRIIVYIPFNNLDVRANLPPSVRNASPLKQDLHLSKEWIDNRISIFMNYTLKSLKNQTNQNFIAYVLYNKSSKFFIEQALLNYPPLPSNIHFIPGDNYETQVKKNIRGYKHFYELHLYSDDMYHKTFIEQLHNHKHKDGTKVLICQNGYIYNSIDHILAKYFNFSSSFNCFIYTVEAYLQGVRYDFFKLGRWMGAIKLPHEIITYPSYINHCHDANAAFSFNTEKQRNKIKDVWVNNKGHRALFGEIITDEAEKNKILEEFMGN